MTGVKELKLWQEAVGLAGEVARTVKGWPREQRAFADALVDRSAAVACGVAAGYGSYTTDAQLIEYRAAERALIELETRLAIARQASLLSAGAAVQLAGRTTTVGRLLAGYVAYVGRQVATSDGRTS